MSSWLRIQVDCQVLGKMDPIRPKWIPKWFKKSKARPELCVVLCFMDEAGLHHNWLTKQVFWALKTRADPSFFTPRLIVSANHIMRGGLLPIYQWSPENRKRNGGYCWNTHVCCSAFPKGRIEKSTKTNLEWPLVTGKNLVKWEDRRTHKETLETEQNTFEVSFPTFLHFPKLAYVQPFSSKRICLS